MIRLRSILGRRRRRTNEGRSAANPQHTRRLLARRRRTGHDGESADGSSTSTSPAMVMLSRDVTELTNSIVNRINSMAHGVGSDLTCEASLFPLSNHHSPEELFDLKVLKEFACSHIVRTTAASLEHLEGETIEDMVQKYGAKISANAGAPIPVGVLLSSSMKGSFQTSFTESRRTKFAQVTKIMRYATLTLPAHPRKLLSAKAKAAIDDVSSSKDAETVIRDYGPLYVQNAFFGGILKCSAKSSTEAFRRASDLCSALISEVAALTADAEAEFTLQIGKNSGNTNSNLEFFVETIGGDPALILNGREGEWIGSVASNIALFHAEFAPVSNLAEPGSRSEQYLQMAIEEKTRSARSRFKHSGSVFPGAGRYYLSTNIMEGYQSEGGWYLNAMQRNTRTRNSTWLSCHAQEPSLPLMVWSIEEVHNPEGKRNVETQTYRILTTQTTEHDAGWGLAVLRNPTCTGNIKSKRDGRSAWAHVHNKDKADKFMDWVIKPGPHPNTINIFTTENCESGQPGGWALCAMNQQNKEVKGTPSANSNSSTCALCHDVQPDLQPEAMDWTFRRA